MNKLKLPARGICNTLDCLILPTRLQASHNTEGCHCGAKFLEIGFERARWQNGEGVCVLPERTQIMSPDQIEKKKILEWNGLMGLRLMKYVNESRRSLQED